MWWHTVKHGRGSEGETGEWSGVASTLHTTSAHGVSSITTADAHTSAASSRLNWRLRRFNWTRHFRRKTKSGFGACAVTFQTQSTHACCFDSREWLWPWQRGPGPLSQAFPCRQNIFLSKKEVHVPSSFIFRCPPLARCSFYHNPNKMYATL